MRKSCSERREGGGEGGRGERHTCLIDSGSVQENSVISKKTCDRERANSREPDKNKSTKCKRRIKRKYKERKEYRARRQKRIRTYSAGSVASHLPAKSNSTGVFLASCCGLNPIIYFILLVHRKRGERQQKSKR